MAKIKYKMQYTEKQTKKNVCGINMQKKATGESLLSLTLTVNIVFYKATITDNKTVALFDRHRA